MTKYLIDTQENKILSPKKSPPQSTQPDQWAHWVRTGRAISVESNVIPEVAVYNGTTVVADPQRQAIYNQLVSDIQLLNNTNPGDVDTNAEVLAAVRLLLRLMKFLIRYIRV